MVILGSTGSIGINAQKVAKQFNIEIEALACGSNIALFNEQIRECKPKFVAIADEKKLNMLQPQNSMVFVGEEGICKMLEICKSQKILNAVVGYAGLSFSLKTIALQKELILANKESLVVAGHLIKQNIMQNLESTKDSKHTESNIRNYMLEHIFPIDSEHFSLWSLLAILDSKNKSNITHYKAFKNLYITASGGALRDFPLEKIPYATLSDVLKHPTWSMGQKITIDSATLVNKLYEILEAYWLFDTKNIHAFIERSSLVHAFIESSDNSLNASVSYADMCLPLAYGMDRFKAQNSFCITPLSINDFVEINFQKIQTDRYPLWAYKTLLLEKPHLGIALNASNELVQQYFLQEKLPFYALAEVSMQVLEKMKDTKIPNTLESILAFRQEARALAEFFIKNLKQR
ncbi:1-deoxy-D-xylulose-5-phosphate reductoisomerase [Helicobacter bilis]|uniref:1-deoxy-D-xylulose 5-phosphate reductoisomerase n=1 Tax=Helicobacter bilis TaxID=37372 RepID=A0A4U8U8Z8_9HELI|nr:1-deoxy-D-xylulose-5-phosphate reductoisomerase [Helicobacter bilis]MCI7410633.1 1-deoxy-D-xylulose-5-phosphate reductoisomerase [Helicobacter bilis]MDD7295671.1 1-deoxy-D-xylulose-5-phosphate reductoisomerase [Helicobacter bilis]MDY4400815.1 1-deoxy-D-xylulose-5-phosphate reductoisomerase [Helicobacter bilis]TLE10644.1 1-deoxy-D-xylulose-5-phosphate reductoisomerase [Helicobacter bilis]